MDELNNLLNKQKWCTLVIYEGHRDSKTKLSWCGDCNTADLFISTVIIPKGQEIGWEIVFVNCGE